MIWKILEIEKTKDEEKIKSAYREKLRLVNPEDDQEGFMELRGAYEEAMRYASMEENEDIHDSEDEGLSFTGRKNDVDLWIDKVDQIYVDVKTRIDESKWNVLLKDDVCENLDTELEAGEKLLVYFMAHANMPQNIWKLLDKRFDYIANMDDLKEKFPENYLEYVKWQIKHPGFIDYNLFDGKTNKDVDVYINKLYEVKSASEERDLQKVKRLLTELRRFDVTHPFADVEEARCKILEANTIEEELDKQNASIQEDGEHAQAAQNVEVREEKKKKLLEEALSIMEDLDFEYSDNPYIERVYAEALLENKCVEKARATYEALLEADSKNYMAMLGIARCTFIEGNPEDAKEQVEDVLEDRVQDADALQLLDKINIDLVEKYEARLKEEFLPEVCYKLGWCYYQQKKFDEGIALLDKLQESEDYDYVNLRCRLYLAGDHYKEALPWAEKWLELIENLEDDGTKDAKKRKNRLSLAHFSLGICHWENTFKNAEDPEKESIIQKVRSYIERAIEEETNTLVQFSYMEQLARFYLDAKKYESCIEMCDRILEKDRGFFPAYVHRQKAHYELKHAKEVIDDYFSCIELYPPYAPPYVLAAEVFYAFDQYDDVEQVLNAAKEAELESHALELYNIRCLHYKEFSKDNTQKALELMMALREKVQKTEDETDIENLVDLEKEYAILHWDLDKVDETLLIIDGYLETHPNTPEMLHLKADVLNRENRLQEALEVCQYLVRLEPNNLYTKTKLGNCYERLNDIKNAVVCYEEILDRKHDFAPALRRMMYVYSYLSNRNDDLKQCQKAIDFATRFIQVTDSAEGYVERGNLYIDLYDLHQAVSDCKKAIEIDSEAYYAYNNLGCALLKLRQIDKAIIPLEKVIEMDPDRDHLPYLNLAECYVLKKEYDKAMWAYKEVMRIRPDATHYTKEIAKIKAMKKDYSGAIRIYQEMIDETVVLIKMEGTKKQIEFYFGTEPSDLEKRLMLLYCDLFDVYRQAGMTKDVEKCIKLIYSTRRKLFKKYNADVTEKVAEYYRDSGQPERALWVLNNTKHGRMATDEVDTWDDTHMMFVYATVFFELGQKFKAKQYAHLFIDELLKKYGGEKKLLSDKRYLPSRLYDLGIMYVCAGELDKARSYLEQIPNCKLCVMCETCDCFEYYFSMGLIAELEGRKGEAIRLYEKAIEIKGDYPCARNHLNKLQNKNI